MKRLNDSGQTLIALLIFMLVAMTITIASIAIAITNIRSNISYTSGEIAFNFASSGVENGLNQIQRNPSYTGSILTFTSGTATITVSGTSPYTIVSIGENGNFQRTITATAKIVNNNIVITNWSETP